MRFSINRAGLSRLIRSYLITLYGPCIVYGLYSIYELKYGPSIVYGHLGPNRGID